MKYIYWNIRGAGNLETQLHLFHMIKLHKPDFLFLAEPLIDFTSFPSWFWNRLNLHNHILNNNNTTPSIWCLWNKHYNLSILLNTSQCVAFTYIDAGTSIFIAVIYASTFYIIRRGLWSDLSSLLHDHLGPWMFVGDFNSIIGEQEKLGGRIPLHITCNEFLNWTNKHSLVHLDTNGARFTWSNNREGGAFIAQRLDRAICNDRWIDYWNVISCNTLVRCFSYHFPLLLTLHQQPPTTITPRFKFFKSWTTFDSCEAIVSDHWAVQAPGSPMHVLHYKLKSLKPKLQLWNKLVVGNHYDRVNNLVKPN